MKNRTLILNDLFKMQESNTSLGEMITKLQHYNMSYYETLNILNEVTHNSLKHLSETLLKDPYWENMKLKTDEKENLLTNEYEAMIHLKHKKQHSFDEHIQETYQSLMDKKKEKEKKLKNLDKHLTEIFQK